MPHYLHCFVLDCTDYSYGCKNVLYGNIYSSKGCAQIISVIYVLRSCTHLKTWILAKQIMYSCPCGFMGRAWDHGYGHAAWGRTWEYSRSFTSDQTAGKVFSIEYMPYILNSIFILNYFSWWSCKLQTIWSSSFELVSHIRYLPFRPLLLLQCIIIIIQYLLYNQATPFIRI